MPPKVIVSRIPYGVRPIAFPVAIEVATIVDTGAAVKMVNAKT